MDHHQPTRIRRKAVVLALMLVALAFRAAAASDGVDPGGDDTPQLESPPGEVIRLIFVEPQHWADDDVRCYRIGDTVARPDVEAAVTL